MLSILERAPLKYEVVWQKGSHRKLRSPHGYPPLSFSFHDGTTLAPGLVRKILVAQVGLSVEQALELL